MDKKWVELEDKMNKQVGYIIMAVGLLVIALSFPSVAKVIRLTLPSGISNVAVMAVGVIIIIVGAFFATRGSSGKVQDVPIYGGKKGNEVVGFRRMKK